MEDQDKKFIDDRKQQLFMHFRLGEHLLQRKIITLSQLVEALAEQQKTGGLIGEILVQKGFISYEKLLEVLESQFKADKLVVSLIMEIKDKIKLKKVE